MGKFPHMGTIGMWSELAAIFKGRSRKTDLFPLKMATFERYMLADDRRDYPMSFAITIEVTGDLRKEAFESALRSAIERHPLLSCRVRLIPFRGLCWVPHERPCPSVNWQNDGDDIDCPEKPGINLFREAGLRVWVRKQHRSARVVFQFHHAATDGLGAMQFIGDLLALYGISTVEVGQEAPELEQIDQRLLNIRETAGQILKGWRLNLLAILEYYTLLTQPPAPVALPKRSSIRDASQLPFPAFIRRTISRDLYRQLKEVAAQKSVTPNDLLVSAMFATMREWNRLNGKRNGQEPLRIAVPVSLRTPEHDQMPAANVVSYVFVNEKGTLAKGTDRALQSIHQRTEWQVSRSSGEAIVQLFRYGTWVPGLLEAILTIIPCFATVTLANVGDVRRQLRAHFPLKQGKVVAGNIQLEALVGAAPVRRNSRVSVSLGVYAGTLFVNMHCDPKCFTRSQAETLADMLARHIHATATGAFPSENHAGVAASGPLESAA